MSSGGDPMTSLALKAGSTAFLHPVEYAKTLMQLGHEPLVPVQSKTLMGKQALALPNVFKYIGIIKKREGLTGLYSGLTPRILGK